MGVMQTIIRYGMMAYTDKADLSRPSLLVNCEVTLFGEKTSLAQEEMLQLVWDFLSAYDVTTMPYVQVIAIDGPEIGKSMCLKM
jgi:hypothetical protein